MSRLSTFVKLLLPPACTLLTRAVRARLEGRSGVRDPGEQLREDYWGRHAEVLESWGSEHVWNEIQMFLFGKKGRVLDIACGSGQALRALSASGALDVYGIDNSPILIERCTSAGVPPDHLKTADVSEPLPFPDGHFDYSYSIGLLHYLPEDVVESFLREDARITSHAAFHFIPVSIDNSDHGTVFTWQHYTNNSIDWWLKRFRGVFGGTQCVSSAWKDETYGVSRGVWIGCVKKECLE